MKTNFEDYIKECDGGGGDAGGGDSGGNAYANAGISGMGDVINAQPGALPGTFGTDGSGDISNPYGYNSFNNFMKKYKKTKKKRRKKGDATQVTDLRDLKPAKVNRVSEALVPDLQEYIQEFEVFLRECDLRPLVLTKIMNFYKPVIEEGFEKGTSPYTLATIVIKELELDKTGFGNYKIVDPSSRQTVIKYL